MAKGGDLKYATALLQKQLMGKPWQGTIHEGNGVVSFASLAVSLLFLGVPFLQK